MILQNFWVDRQVVVVVYNVSDIFPFFFPLDVLVKLFLGSWSTENLTVGWSLLHIRNVTRSSVQGFFSCRAFFSDFEWLNSLGALSRRIRIWEIVLNSAILITSFLQIGLIILSSCQSFFCLGAVIDQSERPPFLLFLLFEVVKCATCNSWVPWVPFLLYITLLGLRSSHILFLDGSIVHFFWDLAKSAYWTSK